MTTIKKLCAMKILNCQPVFLFFNSGNSKLDRIQVPISICIVLIRIAFLINTITKEKLPKGHNDLKDFCLLSLIYF